MNGGGDGVGGDNDEVKERCVMMAMVVSRAFLCLILFSIHFFF